MNIQEAKICVKCQYIVHINGKIDTFGYWKPDKDTPFLICSIKEFYNKELKTFSGAVEVTQPNTSTRYTVKLSAVFVDEHTAKLLAEDVKRLKDERLERIITQMITEGANKTEVVDRVKSVFEKVKVEGKNEKAGTKKSKRFVRPSVQDVEAYCQEKNLNVNAQEFIDFYDSNGWKVGKNAMKDWKAACRNWHRRDAKEQEEKRIKSGKLRSKPSFDIEAIERRARLNDDYDI